MSIFDVITIVFLTVVGKLIILYFAVVPIISISTSCIFLALAVHLFTPKTKQSFFFTYLAFI